LKTIIAGSRNITDYSFVSDVIKVSGIYITRIISGGARGPDKLGIRYAIDHKIPYDVYEPDWDKYGKQAGFLRNCEMGDNADALIAIWDGYSRGTKHMIDYAMNSKRILKVHIVKNIKGEVNNAYISGRITTWG